MASDLFWYLTGAILLFSWGIDVALFVFKNDFLYPNKDSSIFIFQSAALINPVALLSAIIWGFWVLEFWEVFASLIINSIIIAIIGRRVVLLMIEEKTEGFSNYVMVASIIGVVMLGKAFNEQKEYKKCISEYGVWRCKL